VPLTKNYGFAAGNNFGAMHANGRYLVFLNPDTEVTAPWLEHLVFVLESNPNIGIAQPELLKLDNGRIDSAGGFIDHYGLVRVRGSNEKNVRQYTRVTEIFYAKGAAIIVRRNVWDKLGGFDPIFFTYFEETDLCWRSWEIGYSVVYIPDSKVYHFGGGSLNQVPIHTKFHEAKGRIVLLAKHYSIGEIFRYIPVLLSLYAFNAVRHISTRNSRALVAILKATIWCCLNFQEIWLSRIRSREKVTNGELLRVPNKLFSPSSNVFCN